MAISALLSVIPNTRHYRVRPRRALLVAALRSIWQQWAQPPRLPRPSLDRMSDTDRTLIAKDPSYRLQQTCAELAPVMLELFLSDRILAKVRAGSAGMRPATGEKAAMCGPVERRKRSNTSNAKRDVVLAHQPANFCSGLNE